MQYRIDERMVDMVRASLTIWNEIKTTESAINSYNNTIANGNAELEKLQQDLSVLESVKAKLEVTYDSDIPGLQSAANSYTNSISECCVYTKEFKSYALSEIEKLCKFTLGAISIVSNQIQSVMDDYNGKITDYSDSCQIALSNLDKAQEKLAELEAEYQESVSLGL